jgi:hypothetical protein
MSYVVLGNVTMCEGNYRVSDYSAYATSLFMLTYNNTVLDCNNSLFNGSGSYQGSNDPKGVIIDSLWHSGSVGVLNNTEIDFIAKKADKTIYIQVSYLIIDNKTKEREFGNLLRIKDNYPKYVISLDSVPIGSYQGIIHLHLRDFLKMDTL